MVLAGDRGARSRHLSPSEEGPGRESEQVEPCREAGGGHHQNQAEPEPRIPEDKGELI
jgi:hypothetical protein